MVLRGSVFSPLTSMGHRCQVTLRKHHPIVAGEHHPLAAPADDLGDTIFAMVDSRKELPALGTAQVTKLPVQTISLLIPHG